VAQKTQVSNQANFLHRNSTFNQTKFLYKGTNSNTAKKNPPILAQAKISQDSNRKAALLQPHRTVAVEQAKCFAAS
jgi:hypothetical protein